MVFEIKTDELPLVRFIGEVSYKQPWTHFERTANEYILYVISKGTLYIEESNCQYVLNKKDFFLFEPNRTHKGYKDSTCEYFYIHFMHKNIQPLDFENEDAMIKDLQERRHKAATSNCLLDTLSENSVCCLPKQFSLNNIEYYIVRLREAVDNYVIRLENYKEIVSSELLNMLIRMSRDFTSAKIENKSKTLTKASDILNYLNVNYPNKLTSQDIKDRFEGNFDYLNRCFREMTGHSIFKYLNMIRINKSKELILTTNLKFNEIGYLVGIENPYYFSRLFKFSTGITPTEYFKEHGS